MVNNGTDAFSSEDALRILIASDIHLGYLENDPVRGEDSFIAFEEVLSLAVQCDVDIILLGGDLFDHAKPSPNCMFKCTQIIRKYCLGDKPVSIELLSDQLENFSRTINYEDPNLNVSYPILSIHGNHDDPVGQGSISSLDILSITGLVNYFGKWTDYTQVRISPVLMQKGETKLALYGLSHLKDQRLARLYAEKKVEMELPEDGGDWFNLFVLHQNRADRGPYNYIPEKVLPNFLDLVIWGHEHDSQVYQMRRQKTENDEFSVIQPGSTVATSLAAGEALQKHCALLQIYKKEFIVNPLPLKTVRPFIFKTIVLSEENFDEDKINEAEKVQTFLKDKVQEAIDEANNQRSGDPKQPSLPLVRLSVFYDHEGQNFNKVRFGQNFNGLVANPNDILLMKREKKIRPRKGQDKVEDVEMVTAAAEASDIESLLRSYYDALPVERRLIVLLERSMTDAIKDFTLKHDDEVFKRVFEAHKKRSIDFLMKSTAESENEINEQMRLCKQELENADTEQLNNLINMSIPSKQYAANAKRPVVILSSDDEEVEPTVTPGRGRARGGRATRSRAPPKGRGRGRGVPSPDPPPSPTVGERRTPRRAAQKTTSWLQSLTSERSSRQRRNSSDDSD